MTYDNSAFIVLAGVFLLSYAFRKFATRSYQFPHPTAVPFLGNIFGINMYRFTDTFTNWHKQLGDTIEAFFMNFTYVDTINHKIVSQVIHSSDRDDLYIYTLKDVMGDNSVILLDGPVWKKQRRIISSSYTSQALHKLMVTKPNFVALPAQHLVSRLAEIADSDKPLEMDLEFSRVSLAVIGITVFNYDFDYCDSHLGDPDAPFLRELWDGMDEYNKRMKNPLRKYLNPYSIWRFSHTMGVIKKLVNDKLDKRIACNNVDEQGQEFTDSLGVMLKATDPKCPEDSRLTRPEVVDNIITLLLAGHETTAHALSFACYEVARNPAVEKKLIESLAVIGNRAITVQDLASDGALRYCGWIVQEALRVHPVAASILRKFHEDQPIGDQVCAKEYNVGITLPMLHNDERIWPNPGEFDPERFDECNDLNLERPVTSYLPFGGGPRTCIGKKLALLEMKYMLATLYRNFVFRLIPDFKYDVEITVTMHEIHGMPLLVQTRD